MSIETFLEEHFSKKYGCLYTRKKATKATRKIPHEAGFSIYDIELYLLTPKYITGIKTEVFKGYTYSYFCNCSI